MAVDLAGLARAELRFRSDIWSAAPPDAIEDGVVPMRWFGPLLATAFTDVRDGGRGVNVIEGAAEPWAVAEGHLGRAVEWMEEWEVDYAIAVTAGRPEADRAEQWLSWHGYEQGGVVRRFVRPAVSPPERLLDGAEVEVRELGREEAEGMSCLAAESLGLRAIDGFMVSDLPRLEGWRCYIALPDGLEAACGSMLVVDGIAILGLDATARHARGRGCHLALVARRLADAAQAGCHTVLADICNEPLGGPATRNLHRTGFVDAGRSVTWSPARGRSL